MVQQSSYSYHLPFSTTLDSVLAVSAGSGAVFLVFIVGFAGFELLTVLAGSCSGCFCDTLEHTVMYYSRLEYIA